MTKYMDSGGLSHFMTTIKNAIAATVTGVKGNAESSYRTGQVNLTPANIGAVAKSGDTMTGKLTLKAGQYADDYTTGALDLQNSNIQGVNSIYTSDVSENAAEGVHFYRDATHVDSIHAKSGELYFTPNRALGSAGTSEKVLRETSALKESLLTWGGKNFSASYGPIDAAMIGELGANRLAFSKAAGIAIEYSRDGGATWTDYGVTDAYKVDLFARGRGFAIGKYAGSSELGQVTTDWKLRVTLTTNLSGTYTTLNKFAFYVTTNGASRSYVTITARTKANLDAGNDTWTTFAEDQQIAGWSGWNIVNTSGLTTYGNTSSQYANVRFEFGITGTLSTTYSNALSINRIMGFGGVGWAVPSNMAIDGHLYSYDGAQNAWFPGHVYPSTDNSKNLGHSSYRWANVYAVNLYGVLAASNITGTLPIANGGTGATTAAAAANAIFGGLPAWTADPNDNTYLPRQDTNGGASYGKVKFSTVWNYIKGKFTSTMLSSATDSSSEALAATPKAVKAAYDLANGANTTAGQALSAATGALAFKVTYSISNGDVVCAAHVYSAGSEVTNDHNDSCFVWSMSLDGGATWTSLGTGKTKTVSVMSTFGGNVKCDFTPAS